MSGPEARCATPQRCNATRGGDHCWHAHIIGGRQCCGCGERDIVPPTPENVMYLPPKRPA